MLGLLIRPVAIHLEGEIAVAYVWIHVGRGSIRPWANGGELAADYCFVFLFLAVASGRTFSVDNSLSHKKES